MKNKPEEEPIEPDIFSDERVTITMSSEKESPFGKMQFTRIVSNATAKKIFKLLTKQKQMP